MKRWAGDPYYFWRKDCGSVQMKKIIGALGVFLLILIVFAFDADSATIRVPADYPAIQDAIVAAADGDTVLVDPGTYVEHLDFLGKGITVAGTSGPEVTIIDAKRPGMTVLIYDTDPKACKLEGFTIRSSSGLWGPAVHIERSSPVISGNIFDSERAMNSNIIEISYASPVVTKNIFRNIGSTNAPDSLTLIYIAAYSYPLIANNIFHNNAALAIYSFSYNSGPMITNNTIVGNKIGIKASSAIHSPLNLYKNNIIVGNTKGLEIPYGDLPYDSIWQNNLVFGNTNNYVGIPDQTGINGNISAYPRFLDRAGKDFHLRAGSPAIDAGNGTALVLPDDDFDGNQRVIDGHGDGTAVLDMGAFEFGPEAPPLVSFQADKVSGVAPLSVKFTSMVSTEVTEYNWDFGDGTSSKRPNPEHSFATGTYTVSLNVFAPTGTGTKTREDFIYSYMFHEVTASAGTGGSITPSGLTTAEEGSSLSYTITANPGYKIARIKVDGVPVGAPSAYTFDNIGSGHTIEAIFAHNFNYFGIQAGNHHDFLIIYTNGSTLSGSRYPFSIDDIGPPHSNYLIQEGIAGVTSAIWYIVLADRLLLKTENGPGAPVMFNNPLPMIKKPVQPNTRWTAKSGILYPAGAGTASLTAAVAPMRLVNVPAGKFLAYPIVYHLSVPIWTGPMTWTDYFAPYIGVVQTNYPNSDIKFIRLTKFAVGEGTVTTPAPIITEIVPASAPPLSRMVIKGYQFGNSQGSSTIKIGSRWIGNILSWTDTAIECVVPKIAVSGPVTVITDTWTSNDLEFTVMAPPVTGVNP